MDKILVTGVCGHIGSSVFRILLEQGYDVIGVDNMLTQRYTALSDVESDKFTFVESDFMDIDIPSDCIVIHLAAITNAENSMFNKEDVEKINVDSTKQFIDKCISSNVRKFIFPSSTSVYGVSADLVHEDDAKFENPQSPYAESKLEIERYLESKSKELDYTVLRLGTIYGWSKGMRFHTAINKFCWQIATGQPITIWKQNYEQVRPYLYLEDASNAILFALSGKLKSRTKYNVLTDNYKLSEIVELLKKKASFKIDMVDTPLLNQYTYNVSDEKIKGFNFYPSKNTLEKSLTNTLYHLRNLV